MALKLTTNLGKGSVNINSIQSNSIVPNQSLLGNTLVYFPSGWNSTPSTVETVISGTIDPNSNFSFLSPTSSNQTFSLSNPTGAFNSKIIKLQSTNTVIVSTQLGTFNLDANTNSVNLVFNSQMWMKYNSPYNIYNFYPSKYITSVSGIDDIVDSGQGFSTSISGNGTVMASGGSTDNNNIGAVWVFTTLAGTWQQQTKIVPDGYIGTVVRIGYSVSLSTDGQTLAIGGMNDNGGIGATWIFVYSAFNSKWNQISKLVGTNNIGQSQQGYSVSLNSNGSVLAVGGPFDNNGIGAVWIFTNITGTWTQVQKLVGSGGIDTPGQGYSVSLYNDTVAIGGLMMIRNLHQIAWEQLGFLPKQITYGPNKLNL